MSTPEAATALGELQTLLGELAATLRQAVPKIRGLEAEAFTDLPPEMEELEELAPYPESVRRGLDLIAAERLPSLVALLEALASASPSNPDPDDELLARTRAAFSRVLRQLPRPAGPPSRQEIEEWLARPAAERWAEARTAATAPDYSTLQQVLVIGAQRERPAAERQDIALWVLARLARVGPGPQPRGLWIDLQARAWALLGWAALEAGELRRADYALEEAWVQLERGSGDPYLLFEVAIPAFLLDWKEGRSKALSPTALRLFAQALRDRPLEGELCLWQALYDEAQGHGTRAEQARLVASAKVGREPARAREAGLRQLLARLGIDTAAPPAEEPPGDSQIFDVH